jgi:hypothetical protein
MQTTLANETPLSVTYIIRYSSANCGDMQRMCFDRNQANNYATMFLRSGARNVSIERRVR